MIGKYISELLFQFDSVTIPSFGTLKKSLESKPAHPVETIFSPPAIKLEFDNTLQHNDGVLANYIAEKERIPFFESLSKIRMYVEEIQRKLESDNEFILPQIGSFSKSGNEIAFVANEGLTLEAQHYGLSPVEAKPIIRNRPAAAPVVVIKKKKSPVLIIVMSFIAIIGIGIAAIFFFKPYKNPKYSEYFKSIPVLNEENHTIAQSVIGKTGAFSTISSNFVRISYSDVPKNDSVAKVKDITPVKNINISTQSSQSGNYLIVAGSFKSKENADNYLLKLKAKGYSPEIIQASNGMYMITYGRYSDLNAANTNLEKIKSSENPAAWVLKY